jgi:methionine-rich copper-binding protein CopC
MKKLIAWLLALLLLVPAAPALAHAQLTGASPKSNSVLKKAPTEIKLVFDEDLIELDESNQIQVTNSKKQRVDKNDSRVIGNQLKVSLKKLVPGKYRVSYRALSSDGHLVTASYSFTLKKN